MGIRLFLNRRVALNQMHLGLQAPVSPPKSGGAFTFEWDTFNSILRVANSRGNKVTVFGGYDAPNQVINSGGYSWVTLDKTASKLDYVKSRFKKIPGFRACSRSIRALHSCMYGSNSSPYDEVNQKVLSAGVDFFIHIRPFLACNVVPYSTVVWDLEHRRIPFFPELSINGEWELREKQYAEVLPRASVVVTGTNVGKEQLERFYGLASERIVVLPHPTPSDCFQSHTFRTAEKKRDDFLLYPAQFWPHKNHIVILRALSYLANELKIIKRVCFTGSDHGNYKFVVEEANRLGVIDQVDFAGFVSRAELIQLYDKASALVYTSYGGPENLPPLEAFARGCPVIAADIPGAREQLGKAASLVNPCDHIALAKSIVMITENEACRVRLIEDGYTRASKWTSDMYAKGLISEITQIGLHMECWRKISHSRPTN
jgi:glycosyltransferase involved in cell wall biosynthesis